MKQPEIFVKTTAGAEEIKARSRKLPPRLRTMLIMVDGTLSVSQLQDAAATLGAPNSFLEDLLQQGLISRLEAAAAADASIDFDLTHVAPPHTDAERFRAAQKFMNDTVVDAIGLRAFFFTLKLEKCFNRADLRALLPEFSRLITKGSGTDVARVLSTRATDMIG